jgi:hypothetical protein
METVLRLTQYDVFSPYFMTLVLFISFLFGVLFSTIQMVGVAFVSGCGHRTHD